MRRTEINQAIDEAIAFFGKMNFVLPAFAFYSPDEWLRRGADNREIFDLGLGWDVTDQGRGKFKDMGLTLFTLRNGSRGDSRYPKTYAEKIMLIEPGQHTPLHFHWDKREDIINRGGGLLQLQLFPSRGDESPGTEELQVAVSGNRRTIKAGEWFALEPGESIELPPRLYHTFYAEGQRVLAGEVSTVNDDAADNRFTESMERFPLIDEDEEPRHLLCNDYESFILEKNL